MKRIVSLLVLLAFQSVFCATGNLSAYLASKAYDEDEWEPAAEQPEFGIMFDIRPDSWPVNLTANFLTSVGDIGFYEGATKVLTMETTTSELNIGVRKIWENWPRVRPFIGGGISYTSLLVEMKNEINGQSFEDDGSGGGAWLGGGVYWTLAGAFNIGGELIFSGSEVEYEFLNQAGGTITEKIDTGGAHFGLLIGWHW